MKSNRNRFVIFVFLVIISLLIFIFHEAILIGAGSFFAPKGKGEADVIILEGTGLVRTKAVDTAIRLMALGNGNRIVVVFHQDSEATQAFALPNYPQLIANKLGEIGLKTDHFSIIGVPPGHPTTLPEAKSSYQVYPKEI